MVVTLHRIVRSFFSCFLCCLLSAIWSATLLAQPVPPEMAQQVAANWIRQKTGVQKKVLASFAGLSGVKSQSSVPESYTFNMQGGGWVIVAGDDVAYPIIGYALKGSVNPENMPPAFKEWMVSVQERIRTAAQKEQEQAFLPGNTVAVTNSSSWDGLTVESDIEEPIQVAAVLPLLRTTWSQARYYNTLCPYDASAPDWADHRTFVGCVATAMGQVMKYHNWPDQGVGSHAYNHPTYGTLSANFGATQYNWSSMPSSGSVTAYNTAVSTLLYHAGVSVEMDYGPDGSGAYTGMVAVALKTFFKYKDTATILWRSSYSTAAWESMVKAELDARRPLVYRGEGTGGHAFVCDGYSDTNYFHFNWGWNGWYDGYFYLSDLTPDEYNFSSYQGAIFGIEPDGKPEQNQNTTLTSIFSLLLGE